MAREINAELLDTKIEKAQQDLVKAKHRYDAVAATLKDLLDKRDALRQKKLLDAEKIFRILLYDRYKSGIRRFERRKNQRVKGSS